jgi:hypothetical protein
MFYVPWLEVSKPPFFFVSSGDTNGVIYYLGNQGGSFVNPFPSFVNVERRDLNNNLITSTNVLTDRNQSTSLDFTYPQNSYIVIDFKTALIKPNFASIQMRPLNAYSSNFLEVFGANSLIWANRILLGKAAFNTSTGFYYYNFNLNATEFYRYLFVRANELIFGSDLKSFFSVEFYGWLEVT